MVYKIVTYKDKNSDSLFKPSKKVVEFGSAFKKMIEEVEKTFLSLSDALGLAASQLDIDQAFCIVKLKDKIEVFCNPEITYSSPKCDKMEEGCLSFPNVFLIVPRAKEIEVSYQDKKGKTKKIKVKGLEARVLQHEIDHLNGIAFLERAEK